MEESNRPYRPEGRRKGREPKQKGAQARFSGEAEVSGRAVIREPGLAAATPFYVSAGVTCWDGTLCASGRQDSLKPYK